MSDNQENQSKAEVKATPDEKERKAKASKDKTESRKPSKQVKPADQTTRSRSVNLLAILALIIAVASIAGSFLLWRQLNDARQALVKTDEQNKSSISAIKPEVNTLQTKLDSLETQLDPRVRDIASKQQLLQESLQSLQVELGKEQPDDWVLAETEYLMRIANNRLTLERDVNTALAALSIADTRLRDIGNPALIDVRKQLADEITKLGAIETPDITGMALKLRSLQNRVASLPLKGETGSELQETTTTEEAQNSAGTSGWKKFLDEIWTALKSLVTIRRVNGDDSALIPPDQRAFLRENLRLQLETARLALFRNDDQSFHSGLETAKDWLTRYFNTDSGPTSSMLDTLARLNEAKLDAPLPDISGSLNSLREILAQKSVHVIKQKNRTESDTAATSATDTETVTSDTSTQTGASSAEAGNGVNQGDDSGGKQ